MIETRHLKNIDIFQTFLFLQTFSKLIEPQLCTQMSVQGISQKHCIGCGSCPNMTARIPEQCLHVVLWFWLILGRTFLFYGAFIANFEYSLFSVNVTECYLMTKALWHRRYIYGNCCKNCFIAVPIRKTCSMPFMKFSNRNFYILFYFIADLKQVSTMF